MSTSGSFTPAGTAPCPAPMTRAALLALRTAGTLRTECHYTVTDGPMIGTAGNTSPTTIELHATSATELALEARVHTTFSANAWDGLYDIDAGAAGTLFNLKDDWNNFAEDEDANAPTVHTQVPWHKGSATFSGNRFDTATLTGWDTAVGDLTDNTIKGSSVDLTGMTSGQFRRNEVYNGSVFTSHVPDTSVLENTLSATTVINLSPGPGVGSGFVFRQNSSTGADIRIDAATTVRVFIRQNAFTGIPYRIRVNGLTGPSTEVVLIDGNRMHGNIPGSVTQELLLSGTGSRQIIGCDIEAGDVQLLGSGLDVISQCFMSGHFVTKVAGAVGPLNMTGTQFTNTTLLIGAANAAADNLINQSTFRGGLLDLRGPVAGGGLNEFLGTTVIDVDVTVAATATAGLRLNNGLYSKGFVNQNRTAGTQSTVLNDCTTLGVACVVNDNGTVDPGQPVNLNRVQMTDSTITIGNLAAGRTAPDVVSQVDMMASLLFVSGMPLASTVRYGRMMDASLTTAFEVTSFTLDGMVKTAGASQNHRHGSPAFDNWT